MIIELKLYDDEKGMEKTLRVHRVKWDVLKAATILQTKLKNDPLGAMDEIMDVVADVFAGQATREEIVAGADSAEILACFTMLIKGVTVEAQRNFLRAVKAAEQE